MQARLFSLTAPFLLLATLITAADWPRFRGPNFDGVTPEKDWTTTWTADGPKQLWQAALGTGASTVAIADGRLYTMGNVGDTDVVYCLDAETGKEFWRHTYPCPLDKRAFEGGPASTPTVDGDRVFTVSHQGEVFCLDAKTGQPIWSKNIVSDLQGKRPQWGYAESVLVEGDLVILDAGGAGASTVALHKRDGSFAWKAGDDGAGYSSPVPWTWNGQRVVLLFKAKSLVAVDSTDGKELWQFPWKTSYEVNSAVPIPVADKIFITSGYDHGAALLTPQAGTVAVVWSNKNMSCQMNAPVLLDGFLYGLSGNTGPQATLNCVDVQTGALQWSQKELGFGSLLAAGGKLIVLSEKGELRVVAATPAGFQPLADAQVLSGRCWVTPVLVNGRLYCRSNLGTLVCLDVRPGSAAVTAPSPVGPYHNDFEKTAVGKLPDGFVTEAPFTVQEEAGNKFLELAPSVPENLSAQFGFAAQSDVAVSARIWGKKRGRLSPQFSVSLGGVNGYSLRVVPAESAVKLFKGDESKATAPFTWTSEQWTHLRLQIRAAKPGAWKIGGKAWLDGQPEPADWTVTVDETVAPPTGKAAISGTPYSGQPIRFDDLDLKPF